jgi:hypothetical protein
VFLLRNDHPVTELVRGEKSYMRRH